MSDKLPELPSLKISRPVTEADIFERANPCWYDMALVKYWESRARLAVEALEWMMVPDPDLSRDPWRMADETLKAIGPLSDKQP